MMKKMMMICNSVEMHLDEKVIPSNCKNDDRMNHKRWITVMMMMLIIMEMVMITVAV